MNPIRTLSFFSLLAALPALSVDVVTVKDDDGNVVNGETLTIYDVPASFEMSLGLTTNLNGSSARVVNVKRYEMGYASGSQNYFCWGVCYLPEAAGNRPTWVSIDPVSMSPGTDFTGFHAYYRPVGTTGISGFRFVWYAVDDPTDTAYVDIVFDTQNVGMADRALLGAALQAYPNPATGGEAFVTWAGARMPSGAEVVLYNSIGDRMRRVRITTVDRLRLDVADLPAGVYFASVEAQGRSIASVRLAVASR
ncbi:MAG: T9SS type A sorting domain-containing protein [Flavobacteriales bacterium]|nr:T9SS type A sorting domain-containing protein [Flavobacteriales bacterium]